jgi:hypothetical protein
MSAGVLRAELSTTPVADEHRFVNRTMLRYKRKVHAFDARAYAPAAVEGARAMWLARMESEHRSASVFSALCAQLMEAGASWDMESVVLRMAQDEIRHAEVCAEAVTLMGGLAVRDVQKPVAPLAAHRDVSREECALRNIVYGCCLTETVNCARFVDAIDTMRDPLSVDVTKQLLSDEALHAQFGFHYLDAWSGWLDAHPSVTESIARYLRFAFAVLERDMSGADLRAVVRTDDERALGLVDPVRTREIFYTTVEGAILPALDRYGLDARASWERRSLLPSDAH